MPETTPKPFETLISHSSRNGERFLQLLRIEKPTTPSWSRKLEDPRQLVEAMNLPGVQMAYCTPEKDEHVSDIFKKLSFSEVFLFSEKVAVAAREKKPLPSPRHSEVKNALDDLTSEVLTLFPGYALDQAPELRASTPLCTFHTDERLSHKPLIVVVTLSGDSTVYKNHPRIPDNSISVHRATQECPEHKTPFIRLFSKRRAAAFVLRKSID